MDLILQKVLNTVNKYNMIKSGDRVLVGFSGGADSLFLISALSELKKHINFDIGAAHLNHGIRGDEAKRDENFVKAFCVSNNIDIHIKNVDIPELAKQQKQSEESAGRYERYKFFNELCTEYKYNKIAVAHNMNDSVETIVLNMIRGSALKGLCGIRPVNGNIIRPIIDISREQIEKYLNSLNLSFCTDSTNLTEIYTRNKIRHNIIKTMSDINSSAVETIHSNTESLRCDEDFITGYANDLKCISISDNDIIINKTLFDCQHPAVKTRILMNAFELINGNCNNISAKHLNIIINAKSSGKIYNMPGDVDVTISFDKIIFTRKIFDEISYEFVYSPGETLEYLPGLSITSTYCDYLDISVKDSVYIDADKLNNKTITVRNRRDGDRFIPYGMNTNKKIKQFFAELKIPVYKRNEIPILLDGDKIIAVVPYRVSELYKVTENTKHILKITI